MQGVDRDGTQEPAQQEIDNGSCNNESVIVTSIHVTESGCSFDVTVNEGEVFVTLRVVHANEGTFLFLISELNKSTCSFHSLDADNWILFNVHTGVTCVDEALWVHENGEGALYLANDSSTELRLNYLCTENAYEMKVGGHVIVDRKKPANNALWLIDSVSLDGNVVATRYRDYRG